LPKINSETHTQIYIPLVVHDDIKASIEEIVNKSMKSRSIDPINTLLCVKKSIVKALVG